MSRLILLTLLPTSPRDPTDFHNDLDGLELTVTDLTITDGLNGVSLGTAQGVSTPPYFQPLTINNGALATPIIQHYQPTSLDSFGNPLTTTPLSVATAVIVLSSSGPDPEYDSPDLKIVLSRGSSIIAPATIQYNAHVESHTLSTDPNFYILLGSGQWEPNSPPDQDAPPNTPPYPSAYVFVPPKPPAGSLTPGIQYAADGKTPVLSTLITAVNAVLAADTSTSQPGQPTDLVNRPNPLTTQQAQQVAYELTYNLGLSPLPLPKDTLDGMYSVPNRSLTDPITQDRMQWEAALKQYFATNNASAVQLAAYILAATTAIQCEKLSLQAQTAGLTITVQVSTPPAGTVAPTFTVILYRPKDPTTHQFTTLNPNFGVPAAFFYVLGITSTADADSNKRYNAATTFSEAAILSQLTSAQNSGILSTTETYTTITPPVTTPPTPPVLLNIFQAARQLSALGYPVSGSITAPLDNSISTIVSAWLANTDSTANIGSWWMGQATTTNPGEFLNLLWLKICAEQTALGGIIQSQLHVATAADLEKPTDQDWTVFWSNNTGLLPLYTAPGKTATRVRKFISDLKLLFTVHSIPPPNPVSPTDTISMLQNTQNDALSLFFSQSPGFSFQNALVESDVQQILMNMPINQNVSKWIDDALHVISFLYQATAGVPGVTSPMQFSYMEAMYARGFINLQRMALLTRAQFQAALAGTVAYPVSLQIYDTATNKQADPTPVQEPGSGFTPVNPGALVNCCPPPNLSPFGLVEYLHELLNLDVNTASTTPNTSTATLESILSARRGPLGNLKATMANLAYEFPVIDLVNESLENLATVASGLVYDTSSDTFAGFDISNDTFSARSQLLEAIPEHSPPLIISATPPAIYQSLTIDYSAPSLPYSNEFDVSRTYLSRLSCSRFEIMRTFRKMITEFALDPNNEPTSFLSHQWRLPVRLDIAKEYLQIAEQELQDLFQVPLTESMLQNLYGASSDSQSTPLTTVDGFINALGLSYCEFLDLTKAGLVSITNNNTDAGTFPECPPCCLTQLSIAIRSGEKSAIATFGEIAIFVRLWRKLQARYGKCCISMALLAQICNGLQLFSNNQINPDFIRQFLSLVMLCDWFCINLSLETNANTEALPYQRVKILALWANLESGDQFKDWAVNELLDKIKRCSYPIFSCYERIGHPRKLIGADLDKLSTIAGFTSQRSWNSNPECTLRFAEVLSKIISSPFSVGEVDFLYSNGQYRPGDNPFPISDASEAAEDPLEHPDDDRCHNLWHLHQQLLDVNLQDEDIFKWSWHRVEYTLRHRFGIQQASAANSPDPLQTLANHFFPNQLESHGPHVSSATHQFRTSLAKADTSAAMWEPIEWGPFHYDNNTEELWTTLPLTDKAVLQKLAHLRQLRSTGQPGKTEEDAIRELYFAPRAMLTPFGFIFTNFGEAVQFLVQEDSETRRWDYFQTNFAYFHRRCEIIAEHLAKHVKSVGDCCNEQEHNFGEALAWKILQSLSADENRANGRWENDNGQLPADSLFLWNQHSTGSAFAALLGLIGTGLTGEYTVEKSSAPVWKEVCGPLNAFGLDRNAENVPVPTILPAFSYSASVSQSKLVTFRNGFGLSDNDADMLGGASPFQVRWTGALLVQCDGEYSFEVETPSCHRKGHECSCHCHDEHNRWLLRLKSGSKTWTVLSHRMHPPDQCHSHKSRPLRLQHGAYDIEVLYEQDPPKYDEPEDLYSRSTGFMLKYCGPDSQFKSTLIPIDKLYIKSKDNSLASGFESLSGNAKAFLSGQYVSSLRDIRRTYLRAFKALLFALRFHLQARPREDFSVESEIGFMLDHPDRFSGASYYQAPSSTSWTQHLVNFNFNFLPVNDTYMPPTTAEDDRASPSPQRVSALFDCWERVYDYKLLVKRVQEASHHEHHHLVPWRMFLEAVEQQPTTANTLLRHLGIDMDLSPLCLTYYDGFSVQPADLSDERWAVRSWHSWKAVQLIKKKLYYEAYDMARPDLWASDSPDQIVDSTVNPPLTGNNNLLRLVEKACLDKDFTLWKDIKKLNDGLRERARDAMVSYYTRMNRVQLPLSSNTAFATSVSDLSDLLLQDVSTSLCKHTTRIEDGVCAAQKFMQRLQHGLEPNYSLSGKQAQQWTSNFETYEKWKLHKRWQIYPENYVQVVELEKARKSEAFRFLEERLENHEFTLPTSTPGFVLAPDGLPAGKTVQFTDLAQLAAENQETSDAVPDEGVALMGTPYSYVQPSWLTPFNEVVLIPAEPSPKSTTTNSASNTPLSGSVSRLVHADNGQPEVNLTNSGKLEGEEGAATAPAKIELDSTAVVNSFPTDVRSANQPVSLASNSVTKQAVAAGPITAPDNTMPDPGDNIQVPMWFQAAIRLGTKFILIAASGLPLAVRSNLASSDSSVRGQGGKPKDDVPTVDEYYFWLINGEWYDGAFVEDNQNPDLGVVSPDPTSDWDRPEKLPGLLVWLSSPMVHLAWTRVHLGTFDPPCYSADGVPVIPSSATPTLTFTGRTVDSLNFTAVAASPPNNPTGGFRYDLATNFAVALPQIEQINPPQPDPALPDPLAAFPYFVYFEPGAPLIPISSFATVLSISNALQSHCHFDEALTWLRTLYDPLNRDNVLWTPCPPPRVYNLARVEAVQQTAAAQGDPLNQFTGYVRARGVLMNFVQDLLQWAQKLFCENTAESINHASVLFNAAARILGPMPITNSIKVPDDQITQTVSTFIPSKAPLNPQLLQLYECIGDNQRLMQDCLSVRRLSRVDWRGELVPRDNQGCTCRQIEGSWQASCLSGCHSCCLPYRFSAMYQKAMESVSMVKSLSSALLSAFEKSDSEYLAALRQTHDKWLLDLSLQKMKNAYRESDWQVQAVSWQIDGAQAKLRYYQGLHDSGLSQGEQAYLALSDQALGSRTSAGVTEAAGQTMNFIPDMHIGAAGAAASPVDVNHIPLGTKLAGAFSAAARIMNTQADSQSTDSSKSNTLAGWDRRDADWVQQIEVNTIEIEQLSISMHAAQRRRDMALRDLNNHQEQIQHAAEISTFMRDKFTKQDLYRYLQQATASLYRRSYDLALQNAWDAKAAFQYERRDLTSLIQLPLPAWNNLREGLMAADDLDFALQNMQRLYLKTNCREYELTKHISLRLQLPIAFLQLKALGWCEFEIPEWMFDLDYPGHYMRRVKNISLTLPCLTGPYVGVHCRLQQLSSGIRLTPELPGKKRYCCTGKCDNDGECAYEDYGSISRDYIGTEAIATSTGQNDAGVFEVNFHDERFVPFEFSGAVSRWRLELPRENNQFELDTVSDIVLHLNYTAREGGKALREIANKTAQKHLPGDGIRFFDVRHEFPDYWQGIFAPSAEDMREYEHEQHHHDNGDEDDWNERPRPHDKKHELVQTRYHSGRKGGRCEDRRDFPLLFSRRSFPFLTGRRPVTITMIHIFIETGRAVGDCERHFTVHWLPKHDACKDDWKDFVCTASEDMPGFYHGVLSGVKLGPIKDEQWQWAKEYGRDQRDGKSRLGYLRLPKNLRRSGVRQVYLLCQYVADDGERWCSCANKACIGACEKHEKCGIR